MARNTCKDCRWWGWDHDPDDEMPAREMCELTRRQTGDCEPAHPESKAIANGSDGWGVVLWTAPDFGCVQFSPVEAPGT